MIHAEIPTNVCSCITQHTYFKGFVVFVLAVLTTFVDDIEIFYSKYILYITVLVFTLVMFTNSCEIGSLILLMVLIVLIFNNNMNSNKGKQS